MSKECEPCPVGLSWREWRKFIELTALHLQMADAKVRKHLKYTLRSAA